MLWENIDALLRDTEGRTVKSEEAYLQSCSEMAEALESAVAPGEYHSSNLLSPHRATQCVRKNAYKALDTVGEPFGSRSKITFLLGHLLESSHRFMAREAGVELQGDNVSVTVPIGEDEVEGQIDDIATGKNSGKRVLVEFKSMSGYGFKDFRFRAEKGMPLSDTFGYAGQIHLYLRAAKKHDLLDVSDTGQGPYGLIYAISKDTGHVYERMVRFDERIVNVADQNWHDVKLAKEDGILPERLVHDGAGQRVEVTLNKDRSLPAVCSYCPFKYSCWEGRDPVRFEPGEAGSWTPVFEDAPTTGHVIKLGFSKDRHGSPKPVFKLEPQEEAFA